MFLFTKKTESIKKELGFLSIQLLPFSVVFLLFLSFYLEKEKAKREKSF